MNTNTENISDQQLLINFTRLLTKIYNHTYTPDELRELFQEEKEILKRMKTTVELNVRHIKELNEYLDFSEEVRLVLHTDQEGAVWCYDVEYPEEGSWPLVPPEESTFQWTVDSLSGVSKTEEFSFRQMSRRLVEEIDRIIIKEIDHEKEKAGSDDVREEGEICILWEIRKNSEA